MTGPGGWDLPYEEIPDGPIDLDLAGLPMDGLTVRAAVQNFPEPIGTLPILVFDFTSSAMPDQPLPPIVLVGPPDVLLRVAQLVRKSTTSAIRAASKMTGGR